MKASEAKPLSADELKILYPLFQRWALCRHPFYDGSGEQSDAIQIGLLIEEDTRAGKMLRQPTLDEERKRLAGDVLEESGFDDILDDPNVIKVGMCVKIKRTFAVITRVNENANSEFKYEYVWHNGMKPRHGSARLEDLKIIPREQFLAYVKRSGHTSLYEYCRRQ